MTPQTTPEAELRDDIRWLRSLAPTAHCGEGTLERQQRQDTEDRIERLSRALQATAEPRGGEARDLLAELVALVRGECPRLLNEDSGGDWKLSLAIDDALASSPPLLESGRGGDLTVADLDRLVAALPAENVPLHETAIVTTTDDMRALASLARLALSAAPSPQSREEGGLCTSVNATAEESCPAGVEPSAEVARLREVFAGLDRAISASITEDDQPKRVKLKSGAYVEGEDGEQLYRIIEIIRDVCRDQSSQTPTPGDGLSSCPRSEALHSPQSPNQGARVQALEGALRPFAGMAEEIEAAADLVDDPDRRDHVAIIFGGMTLGDMEVDDFRRALSALSEVKGEKDTRGSAQNSPSEPAKRAGHQTEEGE